MRILSVNVGRPRPNEWKPDTEFTGIDKRPVTGPVAVTAPGPKGDGSVGLAGDKVGDVRNHGGTTQAVYAYSREDYDHFETLLGRELRAGMFGENLTTAGHDLSEARIGERWRSASGLVLEVTCARIPCGTFRGWIGERGWLKTFTEEARPGAYLSVIEPGEVAADEELTVVDRPDHDVTIAMFFKACMGEPELIPQVLEAPSLDPAEAAFLRRRMRES
ncbi:MOSC domain-containing protein [Glycomyces buryatensis]|uniref:MOSC domain-containing protein n=1 Tax=Glycomyces buryatensis TaxID=2570927 RepID=A0A4S8QJZ0_9ACTN|nr:MOSC domain-containing protein [Glycomyces buryatensis]THV43622.1 MOSC domain-containing protein [Glycomyces buryatensis]